MLTKDGGSFTTHPAKKNRRRPKHPIRAFAINAAGNTTTLLPPDTILVDSWS
jgi:hypothetical protein